VNDSRQASGSDQVMQRFLSVVLIAFSMVAVAVLLQMQVEAILALAF
jgi:hypothetical protein